MITGDAQGITTSTPRSEAETHWLFHTQIRTTYTTSMSKQLALGNPKESDLKSF